METYNHFDFGQTIADHIAGIDHYLKASSEQDPEDLNSQISQLSGTLLIAVDGKDSTYEYHQASVLSQVSSYCFLILSQTEAGNPDSVYAAQYVGQTLAEEIIVELLSHYEAETRGLGDLIPDSFETHGIGPMGDCYHGILLSYDVRQELTYSRNPDLWQ